IVIEIPRLQIQSSRSNPNITLWTRSLADVGDGRGFAQFDRTALPAINTAVNFAQPMAPAPPAGPGPLPDIQDAFNSALPSDAPGCRAGSAERIMLAFGASAAQADTVVNTVLPDVMPFNTTNRGGFLNGRRLTDDVIDIELGLLSGGVVTSDRVINDSV